MGLWVFLHWLAVPLALLGAIVVFVLSFWPRHHGLCRWLGPLLVVGSAALVLLFATTYRNLALHVPHPADIFAVEDLRGATLVNGALSLVVLGLTLAASWRALRSTG